MSVTDLRPNMDHWQERVDLAAAFRWTALLNMHEAVANHFSLSINDETGLLVDGFHRPPSVLMGHHHLPVHLRRDQGEFLILGDWFSKFTCVRLRQGQFELLSWPLDD